MQSLCDPKPKHLLAEEGGYLYIYIYIYRLVNSRHFGYFVIDNHSARTIMIIIIIMYVRTTVVTNEIAKTEGGQEKGTKNKGLIWYSANDKSGARDL
jgi:hypothetical protein